MLGADVAVAKSRRLSLGHGRCLPGPPGAGWRLAGFQNSASPACIAGLVRGQWAIESLDWLRDTLYREDNSTIRTRSGPRAMAALRNPAIGALHQAGRHDTTEATRWASRYISRPFTILGLN
jgi:hypothetical protein